MSAVTFRPALRENVGLLLGLAGASGSGKTFTAMRLASGISGGKPFALIDTEARRGLHYADAFKFDHADLHAPFRPEAYADAILAADKAGYPAIVVDSMSHVWAGEGGVLDWQEEELERMAGQDWAKRERVKMAAWIKPKTSHKKMVQRLLQVRAHLILCFRADEKLEMGKDAQGKTVITKKAGVTGLDGWFPICDKNLPYELTASFLLMAARPGIPLPIKLQEQHRALFPLDKPITEQSGRAIAEWAAGKPSGAAAGGSQPDDASTDVRGSRSMSEVNTDQIPATRVAPEPITMEQAADLEKLCEGARIPIEKLLGAAKVTKLLDITADRLPGVHKWIDKKAEERRA